MVKNWFTNFLKARTGFLLFLMVCGAGPEGFASQTTVSWSPSVNSDVAGYVVYYGPSSGVYTYRVVAGTNTTATIENLNAGQTNFFVVRAFSNGGAQSLPSNEVSYIVPGVMKLSPRHTATDPTVINFPVAPGHTYLVQASVDCRAWSTIWQTTGVNNNWVNFTDAEAPHLPMRFYRLVIQ
jgi:hypothetical protein